MDLGIIIIGISIVIISVVIYIIKYFNKIKDKKIAKIELYLVLGIISIFAIFNICSNVININKYIAFYKSTKENNIIFEKFDKALKAEINYYNEFIKKDYGEEKKAPYIPNGFEYVEGECNTGFVVQDENKNQYVWVPCTNKDTLDVVKLEKRDFYEYTSIKQYNCLDLEYEEFIESALINGGFYISRFELGLENEKIVSKPNVEIWTNITRDDAIGKINNLYSNCNCKLINGYAYDTTLAWIKKTNEITIYKYNVEEEKIMTGRTKYNNIYDFTDNIMELSLEDLYDTIIYRGFDYSEALEQESRYNILKDDKSILNVKTMNLIGFRSVIYK